MTKDIQKEPHQPGTPQDKGGTAAATPRHEEAAASKARPSEPRLEPELEGLAQLREILFGAVHRDLERRLSRADVHLTTRATELQQEARRRTELLEAHLRHEIEALAANLEREFTGTSDSLRAMGRDHREAITALEQRVAKVEDSLVRGQRESRQQSLEQAKTFIDEVQRLRQELSDTLDRELGLSEGSLAGEADESRPGPAH